MAAAKFPSFPAPEFPQPASSSTARTRAGVRRAKRLAAEAIGDGKAAVAAESARRDLDTRGRLAALVLRAVDHLDHAVDDLRVGARGDDLVAAAVVFDVGLE